MSQSTVLTAGANAALEQTKELQVTVTWTSAPADLDVSCFMVGDNGKVASDAYFVFYNQPADPRGQVRMTVGGTSAITFAIQLDQLDAAIAKCVFAATLDGPGTFADVTGCAITARAGGSSVVYTVAEATKETSMVFAELYRHQGRFKLRAIGRGFNGGLKPLAEAHGVTVADDDEPQPPSRETKHAETAPPAASPPAPAQANSVPSTKSDAPKVNLNKIDLLKRKVTVSLEKKGIERQKARVAVVFDASGSMSMLYSKGTVQRAFERVLAVAATMDDDGLMDVWFFGSKSKRMPSVRENEYEDYVKRTYPAPKMFGGLGISNNEPAAIADIMQKYTVEAPDPSLPVYIVFFSDGGIYESAKISKLLVESSKHNLFWQFVGLGNADFGVLRKLDDLSGRVIDNADFFALDDLDSVTDEALYDRLFNEFPGWLRQAKQKGILRD